MDDLVPLFNLLPGFENNQEIHFPISEHAREIFDRFARRIRFYCMMNTAEDRVNISTYVKVLQTLGRFHLLPRLQFIYTERDEPQLLFLGSPQLRSFRTSAALTGDSDADYVQSFLDVLPSTSPNTETLVLRLPVQERCIHASARMSELRNLFIDLEDVESRLSLGPDLLANFASREILFGLCLHGNITIAPPSTSGLFKLNFDSLVYISLASRTEPSIAEYSPLFRFGKFPTLQIIAIHIKGDPTRGQGQSSPTKLWRDFFKHLRSATTHSLSVINVMIPGTTAAKVSFEDIPELEEFTLNEFRTNLFHSLSAANLSKVFAWWPDLTHLRISGIRQISIGFSSLVEIAWKCPLLVDLEIQINCTTFPAIDDVPILQHHLQTLKLSPRHLENHLALTRCIDRIFPDLVALNISGSPRF